VFYLLLQLGSFAQHLGWVGLALLQLKDSLLEFGKFVDLLADLFVLGLYFAIDYFLVNFEKVLCDVLFNEDKSDDEVVTGMVLAFVALDKLFVSFGDEIVLEQLMV
jgi:hypothetical protein